MKALTNILIILSLFSSLSNAETYTRLEKITPTDKQIHEAAISSLQKSSGDEDFINELNEILNNCKKAYSDQVLNESDKEYLNLCAILNSAINELREGYGPR